MICLASWHSADTCGFGSIELMNQPPTPSIELTLPERLGEDLALVGGPRFVCPQVHGGESGAGPADNALVDEILVWLVLITRDNLDL